MSANHLPYSTYLVLGGVRSGKSRYAERIAAESKKEVIYIATAEALDEEMQVRIKQHQADRPSYWTTIEEPLALADTLNECASPDHILLVDCLTLWLTNLLSLDDSKRVTKEINQLIEVLSTPPGDIILVSNEVGMGIIPMGELTRQYVDESGRLHQRLGQVSKHVTLIVAGLAQQLK